MSATKELLSMLRKDEKAEIISLGISGSSRMQALEQGIMPGAEITIQGTAPMGDPIIIRINGTELAISKKLAEQIEIKRVKDGS